MVIVEAIPYKTFKEKVKIVQEFDGKAKIEIYKEYVLIQRLEGAAKHE